MTSWAIWRTGALGDFILTTPVLERCFEDGPTTVIAPLRYRGLLPVGTNWLDADGLEVTRWLAGSPPPWRVDRAIGWTPTAVEALAQVATRVFVGSPRPEPPNHAADHLWAPLSPEFGPRDRPPRLISPLGSRRSTRVAIAPGAGAPARRWPLARWAEVADLLPEVVWVGGPIEHGERWPTDPVVPPDPAALARLASEVAAWLGPDSGPSHLAAALGTPTGVVFTGASDARCWAPVGATVWNADVSPREIARWATRPTS